jgi:hypothetical protein
MSGVEYIYDQIGAFPLLEFSINFSHCIISRYDEEEYSIVYNLCFIYIYETRGSSTVSLFKFQRSLFSNDDIDERPSYNNVAVGRVISSHYTSIRTPSIRTFNNNVFFKPCTKLTMHCTHRSGHLKTEHTESLLLQRRHLGNWYRGPTVRMRSKLLVAHEKLGQFLLLTV